MQISDHSHKLSAPGGGPATGPVPVAPAAVLAPEADQARHGPARAGSNNYRPSAQQQHFQDWLRLKGYIVVARIRRRAIRQGCRVGGGTYMLR